MTAVYIALGVACLLSLLATASTWLREEYGHCAVYTVLFMLNLLAISALSWLP